MELNLLLLLFVALVPWPTDLLAAYLRDGDQGSIAAVTYGVAMTLPACSFTAIWIWPAPDRGPERPGRLSPVRRGADLFRPLEALGQVDQS